MAAKKKQVEEYIDAPQTLDGHPFYGLELDEEQRAFANAIWNPNIDIVFCNARAGTGKTTIATGVADLLIKYGKYDGIIYIVSSYGEKKQGYLPGTITEKSAVFYEGFYQALITCGINPHIVVNDESLVNQKNGTGYITCITHTFLRGSNLDNKVLILDETQNFSVADLKKTLTRVGSHSKVIVIGHSLQCDMDKPSESGFEKYIEHFKGKDRTALCTLTNNYRGWISQHADNLEE